MSNKYFFNILSKRNTSIIILENFLKLVIVEAKCGLVIATITLSNFQLKKFKSET